MLCTPLFKREIKANYKLWIIFAAVLTMYGLMIISMFDPKLGESLQQMAQSMPQVFAAFGMLDAGSTLIEFTANYLYGFLMVVMPLVMTIILANRLVAHYVDTGSMAYLLAAPVTRRKIIFTQIITLCLAELALTLYMTLLCTAAAEGMFKGELDIKAFLLLNVGCFGLQIFLAGVCFICSCIFNDAKYSVGVSSGLCIAFVLVQMVSQVGDKFDFLKYATPLTLFDTDGIIANEAAAYVKIAILFLCGIALMLVGMTAFEKRDIPV